MVLHARRNALLVPTTLQQNKYRFKSGAGDESRTRDLNLGKVALYQLSYSRTATAYSLPGYYLRAPEKRDYV